VRLPRVCLTGGEPLLQAGAVAELVAALHGQGVRVHLETNGTVLIAGAGLGDRGAGTAGDAGVDRAPDWVTISPKPPEFVVAGEWAGHVDELKFVVDEAFSPEVVEDLGRRHSRAVVCLQPEAGAGDAGVRRAVDIVLVHPEWRLSLQAHKMLGLR
jgi:7-carboxy-7-deazaguanine synthase